jgi:hypothetical protein
VEPTKSVVIEQTRQESPAPTRAANISISLPSLPMGKRNVDYLPGDDDLQCVTAAWLGTSIRAGVSVVVKSFKVSPSTHFRLGGNCGKPACTAGFTFTARNDFCYLLAKPLVYMDDEATRYATVTFVGTAKCAAGNQKLCSDFAAQSAKEFSDLKPFSLAPPWPPEPTTTPTAAAAK